MAYTTKSLFLVYLETDTEKIENTRLLTFEQIAQRFGLQWSNNKTHEFNELKYLYDAIINNSYLEVHNDYDHYINEERVKIKKGLYSFEYKGELDTNGALLNYYLPSLEYKTASSFVVKEITNDKNNQIAQKFIRRAAERRNSEI